MYVLELVAVKPVHYRIGSLEIIDVKEDYSPLLHR